MGAVHEILKDSFFYCFDVLYTKWSTQMYLIVFLNYFKSRKGLGNWKPPLLLFNTSENTHFHYKTRNKKRRDKQTSRQCILFTGDSSLVTCYIVCTGGKHYRPSLAFDEQIRPIYIQDVSKVVSFTPYHKLFGIPHTLLIIMKLR